MKYICTSILISLTMAAMGQELQMLKQKSGFYSIYHLQAGSGRWQELELPAGFSSLSIEIADSCTFDGMQVAFGSDTLDVSHAHGQAGGQKSELLIPPGPAHAFSLYIPRACGHLRLHVINIATRPHKKKALNDKRFTACDKPATIDQDEWRSGLTETAQNPVQTEVQHIILHHSAGSNTNSNYTEVVRNIYIYHREVQGWDDIGYNYVIAQDGSIFDGRDGLGTIDDDNVRGAHYCGKNSNTMGICLLGLYTNTEPTDEAINSLIALSAWKLQKEGLGVCDSSIHPTYGTDGKYLPAFTGHRDGCATECPGEMLYQQLPGIRTAIELNMEQNCQATHFADQANEGFTVSPNPCSNAYVRLSLNEHGPVSISIYSPDGRMLHSQRESGNGPVQMDISRLKPGYYLICIRANNGQIYRKKLIKI